MNKQCKNIIRLGKNFWLPIIKIVKIYKREFDARKVTKHSRHCVRIYRYENHD